MAGGGLYQKCQSKDVNNIEIRQIRVYDMTIFNPQVGPRYDKLAWKTATSRRIVVNPPEASRSPLFSARALQHLGVLWLLPVQHR